MFFHFRYVFKIFNLRLDLIEVKRNFINISTKKVIFIKNPFYLQIEKNPWLKSTIKKIKIKDKNFYKRNGSHYENNIKKIKNLFLLQKNRRDFYENYFNKEKRFVNNLSKNKRKYFHFKKLLNSLLGLMIFFKINFIKKLNYILFIFLFLYFEINEPFFNYILDPKYEHNLYDVDKFAYIPDKATYRNLIKEGVPEKSDSKIKKIGTSEKLQSFRESFQEKDFFRKFLENRLLKYEWIKILLFGSNYVVEKKLYDNDSIMKDLKKTDKNDLFFFYNEYWDQSFLLRRIRGVFRGIKWFFEKVKFLFFGEESLSYLIFKFFKMENYYYYRKMTFNERMRIKINYIKETKLFIGLAKYFDENYSSLIVTYLKELALNILKDKNYRDGLFDYLVNLLFLKIEFRDFLLEKICMFAIDFIDTPSFDNMVIDLLVRVVNSQDVRSSIDRVIKGEPFDIERKMLIDKPYIEYLELLYSRKFRKYWINDKLREWDNWDGIKNEQISMDEMNPTDILSNFIKKNKEKL